METEEQLISSNILNKQQNQNSPTIKASILLKQNSGVHSRNDLLNFSPRANHTVDNVVDFSNSLNKQDLELGQDAVDESKSFMVSENLPKERFFLPDLEFKDKSKSHLMIYDDQRDQNTQFGVTAAGGMGVQLKKYFLKKLEESKDLSPDFQQKQYQRRSTIDYSRFKQQKAISADVDRDELNSLCASSVRKQSVIEQEEITDQQQFVISPEMIEEYYENHPLKQIEPDSWNNIPICIVNAFKVLVEHAKGRDLDHWEKKAQINEQFFKLQHMFLKTDQKQRLDKDNLQRAIDYCQNTFNDRLRKAEAGYDSRLMTVEVQQSQIKKSLFLEMQKNTEQVRTAMASLSELKDGMIKLQQQMKLDLENEKMNIFKMQDKLKKELMESFLIVTENIYHGDNLTITKKNIRQYTTEKVDQINITIQETKVKFKEQIQARFDQEREVITQKQEQTDLKYQQEIQVLKQEIEGKRAADLDKIINIQKDIGIFKTNFSQQQKMITTITNQELDDRILRLKQLIDEQKSQQVENYKKNSLGYSHLKQDLQKLQESLKTFDVIKTNKDIEDLKLKFQKVERRIKQIKTKNGGGTSGQDQTGNTSVQDTNINLKAPGSPRGLSNRNGSKTNLLNPPSPRLTSQNFSNKISLHTKQPSLFSQNQNNPQVNYQDFEETYLDRYQTEKMINDKLDLRIKQFEDKMKKEIIREVQIQVRTQRKSMMFTQQMNSRLFSAAHQEPKGNKQNNKNNQSALNQGIMSNQFLSPRTMLESFDDFKDIISDKDNASKKNVQEWFMQQMKQMQQISRDFQKFQDQNITSQSFTSQASFIKSQRFPINKSPLKNQPSPSKQQQIQKINPELQNYINSLEVNASQNFMRQQQYKSSQIMNSRNLKQDNSLNDSESIHKQFKIDRDWSQKKKFQMGQSSNANVDLEKHEDDNNELRLNSLYIDKIDRYDNLTSQLDQSIILKKSPIIQTSIERSQNVQHLLQSFTASPQNYFQNQTSRNQVALDQVTLSHLSKPLQPVNMKTFEFNLELQAANNTFNMQNNQTKLSKNQIEKRTINTANLYESHARNKQRKIVATSRAIQNRNLVQQSTIDPSKPIGIQFQPL